MKVVKRSIGEQINAVSCGLAAGTIDLATWSGLICLYWQWFFIPVFGLPAMPFYLAIVIRIFVSAMGDSDFGRKLETPPGDGWALLIRQIIKSLLVIIYLGGLAVTMHFL